MSQSHEDLYTRGRLQKKLMKRAEKNYYNLIRRNRTAVWDKYFSDEDFLYLRRDRAFTVAFLNLLTENHNIKAAVWQESFRGNLIEWKRCWLDPEIQQLFDRVQRAYACRSSGRQEAPTGSIGKKPGFIQLKPAFLLVFLAILAGICAFLIYGAKDSRVFFILIFIMVFPVFLFSDFIPEPTFTYIALIWIMFMFVFLILLILGFLYILQNGFNRESRRSFFYTVRMLLLMMLIATADGICMQLTGFSVLFSLMNLIT